MLPGIFIGYSQHAGGGCNGDLLLIDWEQLSFAERVCDVHIKRFKAAEGDVIKFSDGSHRFPLAEGALSQPGNNRVIRRKTRAEVEEEHADRMRQLDDESEVHEEELSPDGGGQLPRLDPAPSTPGGDIVPDDDTIDDGEDYWTLNKSVLKRHHVKPRTK